MNKKIVFFILKISFLSLLIFTYLTFPDYQDIFKMFSDMPPTNEIADSIYYTAVSEKITIEEFILRAVQYILFFNCLLFILYKGGQKHDI